MSEKEILTNEELDDIAGGKSKKKKPVKIKAYCHQCQLKGNMTEHLYQVDDKITFCIDKCHIYTNGMYLRMDPKAVKEYMSR